MSITTETKSIYDVVADELGDDLLGRAFEACQPISRYMAPRRLDGLSHEEAFASAVRYMALLARLKSMSQLAERRLWQVKHQRQLEGEGVTYINILPAWSEYGGPEEGGWFYTAYGEPLASIPYLSGESTFDSDGRIYHTASHDRAWHIARKLLDGAKQYKGAPGGGFGEPDLHEWNPDDEALSTKVTYGAPFDPSEQERPRYE